MSGGGGGWHRGYKANPTRLQDAISQTDQAQYEGEVEKLISDALREFNDRDVEAIQKHLETIENVALVIVSARINRIVHICVVIVSANCPKFEGNGTEIARIPSGNGEFTQPIPTVWPKR